MKFSQTPRPTRSTLLNRRLNRAIRANQLGNDHGMKTVARRSALPPARRQDIGIAITGGLVISTLIFLTFLVG